MASGFLFFFLIKAFYLECYLDDLSQKILDTTYILELSSNEKWVVLNVIRILISALFCER
jgi:hypothetical protein